MRVAKGSAFTSVPNLAIHSTPFASLTRTFGFDPERFSSMKVKGGLGALACPPTPPARSRFSTAPGSAQITGLPTFGALAAFSSLEAFSFCAVADEMKPSATITATSAPILRKFKVITVLLAMVFFWRAGQMIFSYRWFCQQENVGQKNGGRKKLRSDVAVGQRPIHDLAVFCAGVAYRRPMNRLPSMFCQDINPQWRQVHVNHNFHG